MFLLLTFTKVSLLWIRKKRPVFQIVILWVCLLLTNLHILQFLLNLFYAIFSEGFTPCSARDCNLVKIHGIFERFSDFIWITITITRKRRALFFQGTDQLSLWVGSWPSFLSNLWPKIRIKVRFVKIGY